MIKAEEKLDIRGFSLEELQNYFTRAGEKPFRAKQVYEWLWQKSARNFEEMTNLSLPLREKLKEHFVINSIRVDHFQKSSDGTIKSAFRLHDNNLIEGVLIPSKDRMTACVSSQVGCSLTCKFCATGQMKRVRNLNHDEIYDQVVEINRQAMEHHNVPLTNIVYMGMGEPLLNYKNVIASIDRITSKDGLGMSPKRITVSTAGVAKMIRQLADDEVRFNFALSLHAANDEKRNRIMPINEQNSLKSLAEALRYFYDRTETRITYEYIIFDGFNDTLKDAEELRNFCRLTPSKVNIIEYNPIAGGAFKNASQEKVDQFAHYLENHGVIVNIRRSRGKDIDAACGQLANKG